MTNQSQAVAGEDLSDERIVELAQEHGGGGDPSDPPPELFAFARALLSEGTASLVAENERLREQVSQQDIASRHIVASMSGALENVAAERDALRTQLAEAQKDAQRYRCMRDPETHERHPELAKTDFQSAEELDAALDAILTPKEQP